MTADVARGAAPQEIARPFAQQTIELVDQQINGEAWVTCCDCRRKIGPGDFDAPFCDEGRMAQVRVSLQIDSEAKNAWFVPEQPFGLQCDFGFGGCAEVKMSAAKDELRSGMGLGSSNHGG